MKIIKVNERTNNEREITIIKYRNTALHTEFGFSLFGMLLGCFMLAIGYHYLDDCQNGAANWLLIAGILELFIQAFIVLAKICQKVSNKVGKGSCDETSIDAFNSFAIAVLAIFEIAILIWGSVVVFGVWSKWTRESPSSKNYCAFTPMMSAFIILIIKWVLMPGVIVILCILVCFSTCCAPCAVGCAICCAPCVACCCCSACCGVKDIRVNDGDINVIVSDDDGKENNVLQDI